MTARDLLWGSSALVLLACLALVLLIVLTKVSRTLRERRTAELVAPHRPHLLAVASGEELKIMWKLRRVLAALDQQQGIELLIDRIKKTKSNVEFLMQVQQNSSLKPQDDDNS